jgi:hypothetical protein
MSDRNRKQVDERHTNGAAKYYSDTGPKQGRLFEPMICGEADVISVGTPSDQRWNITSATQGPAEDNHSYK